MIYCSFNKVIRRSNKLALISNCSIIVNYSRFSNSWSMVKHKANIKFIKARSKDTKTFIFKLNIY